MYKSKFIFLQNIHRWQHYNTYIKCQYMAHIN